MKTSDSIKHIAEALVAAQKEIRFAVKDSTNPHYKSKYANINSVIDAVKAPLNNNNIAILQSLSPSDDNKLHLTTRLLHSSGEWLEDTAVCPLQKQDSQALGSCVSYIRRYSISSFLALYADDDDGQSAVLNAADYLQRITQSQSLEELQANYNFVMGEVKNDRTLSKLVIDAKDKKKGGTMIDGSRNSNFYGVKLPYSYQELMAIEARKTRIEALKRELGNKYLLTPLYGKIQSPKL